MEENKQYSENIPDVRASFEDDEDPSSYNSPKKDIKSKTPVLDTYSRDLTKMAEEGKLDTIVGRKKEIERVSQILSRRKKNNPILIGEPGCVDGETLITIRKISEKGNHNIIIE
jgi:ATP-dependent Clp protease ATP-binding subunit ClpA